MRRALITLTVCLAATALAQPTVIEDPARADELMGQHLFNLQWIDTPPGVARVTQGPDGALLIDAEQRNKKGDSATAKGRIVRVSARHFELDGTVTTHVSYINGGKPCVRTGRFTFRITGQRKYWRLKQMDNCEGGRVVDYVDIFFARPKSAPAPSE